MPNYDVKLLEMTEINEKEIEMWKKVEDFVYFSFQKMDLALLKSQVSSHQ